LLSFVSWSKDKRGGFRVPAALWCMKLDVENSLRTFLLELVVYAALIAAYYFAVLHFLGGWLEHLYDTDRRVYAAVGLVLILAQGLFLETLTRLLLSWTEPRAEDG